MDLLKMDPYIYIGSVFSGKAQQTFSRAYALLGPAVDTPLGICLSWHMSYYMAHISMNSILHQLQYVYNNKML